MASKYDDLDASTELEQQLAVDLRAAFETRGCEVIHHGTKQGDLHSPGGKPDIELRDAANGHLVLVEVTKRRSSAADGEFLAITDHLERAIDAGGYQTYSMLYVSPATSPRMSTNLRDLWNRTRERESKPGRVVAIDFAGTEMMLRTLAQADPALYPAKRLKQLFARWTEASDDARARQLVQATLFPEDYGLALDLANEAAEIDAERERRLKGQLLKIEDKLRDLGLTGNDANTTLVHLAFIRLYEERRQRRRGAPNRFTREGFVKWREQAPLQLQQEFQGRMVQALLQEIAADSDLKNAGLLRDSRGGVTQLKPELTDARVEQLILPVLDEYDFHAGRVDVLGAVFETLARRGEKDTRVGQFFTPQQVVDFCAELVRLRPTDRVLDPAVGTARFLIAAMERMLANADERNEPLVEAEQAIRERQLVGADIDDWVATIAKMNMFIHGDGKSNLRRVNGLVLGDSPTFKAYPHGLAGQIDVVLTNPPLGDTSYLVAAEHWAELDATRTEEERVAFLDSLGVVPVRVREEKELLTWSARLGDSDKHIAKLEAMTSEEEPRRAQKLRSAYKTRQARSTRVSELEAKIAAGNVTREPAGETLKGGALFLGAIAQYLTAQRNAQAGIEWRGGQAAIVVDEAILNTPEYAATRAFIREHFYIKAVVSLAREAFKYLAHTDAKTSVLFLTRKPHADVVQREPIFFAHAGRVGYNATGSWIGDDLPQILLQYRTFQHAVATAYSGAHFDQDAALRAVAALPGFANAFFARADAGHGSARLDFYDARYQQRVSELHVRHGVNLQKLGDVLEIPARTNPQAARTGSYHFAVVNRVFGTVDDKGVQEVDYKPADLWVVREDDLVVSGIDLVNGAVGVAGAEVDGLVMSKEMYPYRIKPGVDAEPEFVQLILRSRTAVEMLWGLATGTSNRTRLENPQQLLELPIPPLPDRRIQEGEADQVRRAQELRREAAQRLRAAQEAAQNTWGEPDRPALPDPRELPVADAELV
jgi:type I restriction-modification system DNA methylase subunit